MDKLEKILQGIKHRLPEGIDLDELADRAKTPVDWDAVEARTRREDREYKTALLLKRIPERFQAAIPRHEVALEWLEEYFGDKSGQNMVISGQPKTGKTWEASAVAIRLLRRFVPVTMIEVPDLMEALRPGAEDDHGANLAQFKATPVLVLDDLGAEKPSDWTNEQMYSLINYRYKTLLPTIVTTNLGAQELEAIYGERTLRRIVDDAKIVKLTERYRG